MNTHVKFESLVGKTLIGCYNKSDEELIFETSEGETFKLYHEQNCCEYVTIESIVGDLSDLIGNPILMAEEATSAENPPDVIVDPQYDQHEQSQTWTFYKIRTIKGSVDIRWHGTSNGYYSEDVDFCQVFP